MADTNPMKGAVYYGAADGQTPGDDPPYILPGYVTALPEGVFIEPLRVTSGEDFSRIVDRLFASGHYFKNLNYTRFQQILFDLDQCIAPGRLLLADAILPFDPERRSLYHAVKQVDGEVEYIFEPVMIERTLEMPVITFSEDGEPLTETTETKEVAEQAELDPDEFIADMWQKGVRYGLDMEKIRELIASGKTERVVIARERAPTSGKDAGIVEQTEELHRDNSPKEMSNGRLDLRQFKNRFPQMRKGALLLMKTPRELGRPGRAVSGAVIEPDLPTDFDINTLAGPGTRVERQGQNEYIIAAMDGFLNLDSKTNQISITEKIINREGVSARTTGNLALEGDQYEEFGEVQEGRVVQGKSLTFHAHVFGKVTSTGGTIRLEKNIMGGTASNRYGDIVVCGLASNAVLQTADGTVQVKRAENSVITATRVEIEWATNCTILAEEVEIGVSEGCAIAGKAIHLNTGRSRGEDETLITILLPDFSGHQKAEQEAIKLIDEKRQRVERLKLALDAIGKEADIQQYMAIAGKLHRKEITLTPAQQPQWQSLMAKVAPRLKQMSAVRDEIKAHEADQITLKKRIQEIHADKADASATLRCRVDTVYDQVIVRQLSLPPDAPGLQRLAPKDLVLRLHGPDATSRRIYIGDSGEFFWSGGATGGTPEN